MNRTEMNAERWMSSPGEMNFTSDDHETTAGVDLVQNDDITNIFYSHLAVLLFTCIVGLVSNIYIIIKTWLVRSKLPMHIFTLNRSFVDLYVCGFVVPVILAGMYLLGTRTFINDQFCMVLISSGAFGVALSYAADCAVGVYCYMKCVYIKEPRWNAELVYIVIALVSIFILYIIMELISMSTADYSFDSGSKFCIGRDESAYEYIRFVLQSFLPNLVMFASYFGIWKHWKFHNKIFPTLINQMNQEDNIKTTLRMFWGSLMLFLISVALAAMFLARNFGQPVFTEISYLNNLSLITSALQSVYYILSVDHLKIRVCRKRSVAPVTQTQSIPTVNA